MTNARDEGTARRRLIGLWKKTKNAAFLRAAAQLKRDSDEPDEVDRPARGLLALELRRGRKEQPDLIRLITMGLMIKTDPSLSVLGAAKKVAEMMRENKHVELSSVHDRLRRRYKEFKDQESFQNIIDNISEAQDALPQIRPAIEKLIDAFSNLFSEVGLRVGPETSRWIAEFSDHEEIDTALDLLDKRGQPKQAAASELRGTTPAVEPAAPAPEANPPADKQ